MNNTRILFWNTQDITNKKQELPIFVQNKKLDIILLNEIHLAANKTLKIPNYATHTTNKL